MTCSGLNTKIENNTKTKQLMTKITKINMQSKTKNKNEEDEGFYENKNKKPQTKINPIQKQQNPFKSKFYPSLNENFIHTTSKIPKQTPTLHPGLLNPHRSNPAYPNEKENTTFEQHVGPVPRKSQMRRPTGVPCKISEYYGNNDENENQFNNQKYEKTYCNSRKQTEHKYYRNIANNKNNNNINNNANLNNTNNNNNNTRNDRSEDESSSSNNIGENRNHNSNNNNSLEQQDPERPLTPTNSDYIDDELENKNYTIIQWNCNGFYNHFEELKMLITNQNPLILCLQETHFKALDSPKLKNFAIFHQSDFNRAIHGVAICVKNEIKAQQIILNTNLKAVAVRIKAPKEMTICSIYISPRENPSRRDYEHLISQLPAPFLLAGDFNARSRIWSEENSCTKGKVIENLLSNLDLSVMNTGENTHFSTAYGSYSAIDLSIITPSLFNDLNWHVYNDLCSSDHYPIILTFLANQTAKNKRKRWKIHRANWSEFQEHVDDFIFDKKPSSIREITEILLFAAQKAIPKSSDKLKRPQVPWWSPEIKEWIKKRRKSERIYKKTKNDVDLAEFRKLRAKVKYLIKKAKREKWREYVDTITAQTHPSNIWNKIGKISGKRKSNGILAMTDGTKVTSNSYEIANILAEHFERVSSSENYAPEFLQIKEEEENFPINIIDDDNEPYNLPFSFNEFQEALETCKGSSPGNDEIHYQMIINMSTTAKKQLLELYNSIWISGTFPEEWNESLIIPIVKAGKDPTLPNSYRPIALTSCVCKLLEKMANKRLTWFLEKNNFLSENQFGFRKNRSTSDCTITLESEIQKAFDEKEHVVVVSCDLEKAYDTAWRYGILKNLTEMNLKGRLMLYIRNFTNNRTFRVIIGNTLSKKCTQENGVVQGAVISVNLFLVGINGITKCAQAPIKIVGFADDWTLYIRHRNVNFIQNVMQTALDNLTTWSVKNGFRFSPEKTVVMHFHRLRPRLHPVEQPKLKLNGQFLKNAEVHKILGLVFDSKLEWRGHINYIKEKVNKRLNIIKALSGLKWGADQDILLRIHQMVVMSVIEYGVSTYASARKNNLKPLNTLHNQGIRIALGAFKSSRLENLYCEAGMTSLEQRRELLTIQQAIKVTANIHHPLRPNLLNLEEQTTCFRRARATKPFYIRAQTAAKSLDINLKDVWEGQQQQHAPWVTGRFTLNAYMQKLDKNNNDQIIQSEFLEMQQNYFQHQMPLFTDGSKMGEKTGCGIVTPNQTVKIRLPDHTSIYTAELYAILYALTWSTTQEQNRNDEDIAVYTDSLSSIQALENIYSSRHPLITLIKDKLNDPNRTNNIAIVWTPGHRGIHGNELADEAAKQALVEEFQPDIKIPASDIKSNLKSNFKRKILQNWEAANSPMYFIKQTTKRWKPGENLSRRDQIILSRVRIGHTRLTHKHHMEHQPKPKCQQCDVWLSIQHIILDCPLYAGPRRSFNISKNSFGNNKTENTNLIAFLKNIQIYDEI
jgi:ribonuclease HI